MSEDNLKIACKRHGSNSCAIVCRHLIDGRNQVLGFIENSSDPGDYQGWCNDCEKLYLEEQDLTDKFRAFNDMGVVCEKCYFEIREKHEITS